MRIFVSFTIALLAALPLLAQRDDFRAGIVIETSTGQVLFEKDPDTPLPPASMVKMMTLLLVAENVRQGNISWDTPVTTSARASRMGGSQVYLRHNEVFSVRDMAAATMIHSANDAATALAERIAGSNEAFAEMMNRRAQQLGLKNSRFTSPHGLPARAEPREEDMMSPRDLATLGLELMKYPEMRQWAVQQKAPFRNGEFIMYNPNLLLRRNFPGITGLKTGYHADAGFCITATARRGNMEVVAVVMGSSKNGSFENAAHLMNDAFNNWQLIEPIRQGQQLNYQAPIAEGKMARVPVVAGAPVRLLVRRGEQAEVVSALMPASVTAPVEQGQQVGQAVIRHNGQPVGRIPVLAAQPVERAGWVRRTFNWWPF
jgi:serine-type D-Ala-D-Ala carboxypeptidase (penicillin-binding protein 5/6)